MYTHPTVKHNPNTIDIGSGMTICGVVSLWTLVYDCHLIVLTLICFLLLC